MVAEMQVSGAHKIQRSLELGDQNSLAFWHRMSEVIPGIIYVFNHATMSNEYSNCTIAEFLGYSSEEVKQMGDTLFPTLVHKEDLSELLRYLETLKNLPVGAEASFEYRVVSKAGSELWFRSMDTVFETAPDGSVLRHIGIALDVTCQKKVEKRLTEANEQLEARVKARTQELEALNDELESRVAQRTAELRDINRDFNELTFVATHDLKVPINNMTSLTHMLSEEGNALPPEHAETLSWMRDVCQQAGEKLDALICVAQAHSGTFAPFEEVELMVVVERVLVNLHFQIAKTKSVISFDLEASNIKFEPREMENILQSLIGNAVKYRAPDRRPRITVQSRQIEGWIEVSIIDNGTGIVLPRDEDKVFGLFKRAHTAPDGAGVSLYAIRRVLERAGGTITASSVVGQGSCFSFRLPMEGGNQ